MEKSKPGTLNYKSLAKANMLIGAKYKASLLELRVTYASLYAIQSGSYEEKPDGIYVSMKAGELRHLCNANSGSFYKQLLPVAQSMTARSLGIVDPTTESFDFISLITRATYSDGVFTCVFNNALKEHIVSLKRDYTSLPQQYIMALSSNYAFRLYELLKKSCFYNKGYKGERNGYFEIEMSLAELKLDLGVVNSNLDAVQRELRSKAKPNYERAVEVSPEKLYNTWNSFKNDCLMKAIKEINEKTDINVSFDTIKAGYGGKVHGIIFTIYVKSLDETTEKHGPAYNPIENKPAMSAGEKFQFYLQTSNLFPDLNIEDVITISEDAEFSMDAVEKVARLLGNAKNVQNKVGWIRKALEENWEESKKTDKFNNFEQRDFDISDLEKQLLGGKNE